MECKRGSYAKSTNAASHSSTDTAQCLLTGALATQTVTAGYYLAMDAVLISQVAYLAGRARHQRRASVLHLENVEDGVSEPGEARPAGGEGLNAPLLGGAYSSSSSSSISSMSSRPRTTAVAALTAAPLMWLMSTSLPSPPPFAHGLGSHTRTQGGPGVVPPCGGGAHSPAQAQIGMALGWLSAACYLASRVSQLRKNAARGESGGSGLAVTMFATAVLANGLYGTSVLLRLISSGGRPGDWAHAAPWLVGSLGVMMLDIVLATQAHRAAASAVRETHAAAHEVPAATEGYVPPPAAR